MTAQPWEPRVSRLEGAFEQSGDRLNSIDLRLAQIDARFTQVDARFAQIDVRFGQIDARFAQMEGRFAQMDGRFTQIDHKIDSNFKALIGWMLGQTTVVVGAMVAIAFVLHH